MIESRIKRYQLLIVFLIVTEIPLGIWLTVIASDFIERAVVGSFILAVVIAFMIISGLPYVIKRGYIIEDGDK